MKKSVDKFKLFFDNLPDIFYATDMNGTITTVSPSVKKYTEFEQEECINKNINFLFKGNKYEGLFLKLLLSKESVSNYEIQLTDKNNKIHHTLVSANIIKNKAGEPCSISGIIKDICDLKAATEKLYQFATYDELTGAYNRRVGMEFLKQELKIL